ncbi:MULTISPECIES: glycosyltransferase [Paenibacillus]|uniref:glycosyltransferase n=1 Tax=Paenibacillus TaxID=44249 RepID=UPI0007BFACCE|nr:MULTISPECIES: glycosyltransferase [Paenibacillus]MCZ1264381.1 glycosyltransferase [Paenibacillus tundrae]SDL98729.1 Glycosyl transferase family 2 [Paenibacillus sp. OK060]SEB26886.1 Glycosyl transferase family 2 [Paenibacillus sp. 276b]SHN83322.1 Glycosyl transferase family 2 [Paenibacillus sp. ov031]SLK14835.1 Glycosyl transferase family 2 [Paenibacillus sp. RU5A]
MNPSVSIVIPFYNDPYVPQAIQSALNQTYTDVEIIIVNDGSTRNEELLQPYLPYIYVLGKSNGGTASALNHGIRHASGDYIAWLSSDDLLYPDKIRHQVEFMQRENALISHTNFNYINEHSTVTKLNGGAQAMAEPDWLRLFVNGNPVNGCTVMIRRDLFSGVGLFDELLPYTHDLDLWMRILLNGHRFPYLNESLTAYRRHGGMGTVRHADAIGREASMVWSRYREPLLQRIAAMGG